MHAKIFFKEVFSMLFKELAATQSTLKNKRYSVNKDWHAKNNANIFISSSVILLEGNGLLWLH